MGRPLDAHQVEVLAIGPLIGRAAVPVPRSVDGIRGVHLPRRLAQLVKEPHHHPNPKLAQQHPCPQVLRVRGLGEADVQAIVPGPGLPTAFAVLTETRLVVAGVVDMAPVVALGRGVSEHLLRARDPLRVVHARAPAILAHGGEQGIIRPPIAAVLVDGGHGLDLVLLHPLAAHHVHREPCPRLQPMCVRELGIDAHDAVHPGLDPCLKRRIVLRQSRDQKLPDPPPLPESRVVLRRSRAADPRPYQHRTNICSHHRLLGCGSVGQLSGAAAFLRPYLLITSISLTHMRSGRAVEPPWGGCTMRSCFRGLPVRRIDTRPSAGPLSSLWPSAAVHSPPSST